ncbi:MAG: DUF1552 domain-containing protein [Myxococcota bacterium]
MMPKALAANAAGGPKVRTVVFLGMLGVDPHQLFPASVPSYTEVNDVTDLRYTPLSLFDRPISRVLDNSFAPLYPKMNLYHGLSLTGGQYQGHNTSVLSGTHSGGREPRFGKSIDVIMEQSSGVYGADENVVRKAVRVVDHNHQKPFSFDRINGNRTVSSAVQGDRNMFNMLFAGLDVPASDTPSADFLNEGLIVDRVLEDLKRLESNSRLSRDDQQTVAAYIDGVHEVQKNIIANQQNTAPACSVPSLGLQTSTNGNSWKFPYESKWAVQNVGSMYDNIMEVTRLAFACDLTRVVFIACRLWDDRPISSDADGGLHHECPSSETSADRQQYGLKKLASLAASMEATPDPHNSGTLLDNSVLLWTNELGAWTTAHSTLNMPAVTFGGGGGYLKTGNYLDYRQRPLRKPKGYHYGRPYKQLLQSVMRSMGVPQSEYRQFGDGNGFGEFKERVNQFGHNLPDAFSRYRNEHNEPLPFVSQSA